MRVFLDANVLFSAAYAPEGSARLLLALGHAAGFEFVTCEHAAIEAELNLERKAPHAAAALPDLMERQVRILAGADEALCPIPLLAKDRPILAAAIAYRCDVLVTGDRRDFAQWMERPADTGGVRIISLRTLLEEANR